MKSVMLRYIPGDEVYIRGQDRTCYIENVSLRKNDRTRVIETTYEWYNLDVGVDCTEVWDDGSFTEDEVGKYVFDSMQELMKAFPEDFAF